ncbi:MAG: ribonuclease H-like domain-containing protein [Caldilinea sp.]
MTSSTLERMRRLQGLRPQKGTPELTYTPIDDAGDPLPPQREPLRGRLEELLPGAEVTNAAGRCYVVTTATPLNELRGDDRLASALAASPTVLAPFHPDFRLEPDASFADAVFVDTETTGLGTGAGVYAFMVGVGTFEHVDGSVNRELSMVNGEIVAPQPSPLASSHFVVRQFFMRHPGEEAALLAAVAEVVGARRLVVTFNGRGFDLPLLRARYRQNRLLLPSALRSVVLFEDERPHLDLLLPARRLWRRRLQSCRLINLEQQILGLTRTEDDVPGALIPQMYIDYLRTQQAGEMRRVFYHNREDIVSMVALGERLVRAFATSFEQIDGLYAEELLSLAACHVQSGEIALAERALACAMEIAGADQLRADIFARWSMLLKQQERYAEAAELWERWLTSIGGVNATPFIELAKHHEWRTRDLEQAEMWAAWGVHTVESAPAHQRLPGQLADLRRRLMRIQRKRRNA